MAANQDSSVSSRITLFNQQAEDHQNWMMINPFAHYNVSEMPKRSFPLEEYGRAPAGSLSEQRSLEANVRVLEEILQLCGMLEKSGHDDPENGLKILAFGPLFNLYNDISDKLLATLLCARRHGFVDFSGETLFQGRDDSVPVRLLRPFEELQAEILSKVADLRCVFTEKPEEPAVLRQD
ncbi:actin-binding Rho-activating protein [Drosophila rhopaloa]|uniref:Costars domain-containing protein n=1 Tax=Drosophila rhopaloa TaxID=1041015 RepID=A0ABM5J530_DRORH|nr:actin-binding Rho-activating protein [Drosophila rhopaloa]